MPISGVSIFQDPISRPLNIRLATAGPVVARGRALIGQEIEALFRQKLEDELTFYVNSAYDGASWWSSVQEVAV